MYVPNWKKQVDENKASFNWDHDGLVTIEQVAYLANHLARKDCAIQSITIRNELDASKMDVLVDGLVMNTSVYALDFRYCDLEDEGATALAELLELNPRITRLGVADCHIGIAGILRLRLHQPRVNIWMDAIEDQRDVHYWRMNPPDEPLFIDVLRDYIKEKGYWMEED